MFPAALIVMWRRSLDGRFAPGLSDDTGAERGAATILFGSSGIRVANRGGAESAE